MQYTNMYIPRATCKVPQHSQSDDTTHHHFLDLHRIYDTIESIYRTVSNLHLQHTPDFLFLDFTAVLFFVGGSFEGEEYKPDTTVDCRTVSLEP